MAARRRSRVRRDWPKGLHESRPGYFVWRHPDTGECMSIGRVPLADAKLQAIEANLYVGQQAAEPRLIDRLTGAAELTLAGWLEKWIRLLEEATGVEKLSPNTIRCYRSYARAAEAECGSTPLQRCTVKVIADAIDAIKKSRGQRTAQAVRSMLKTAFTAAKAKGLCESNPAVETGAVTVQVQRQRLTWETFEKVWAEIQTHGDPWLRNATALALVTGQRREDIAEARFSGRIPDPANPKQTIEVGVLTVAGVDVLRLVQSKTKHKVEIPLDLRLEVFGMSLREVVADCRRTGVVSRYLIHRTVDAGGMTKGTPIALERMSKRFTDAVAAALGDEANPPTFHELRSLAKRLYDAQGNVDTKALLGHSTERMSILYRDARGAEFERVKVS